MKGKLTFNGVKYPIRYVVINHKELKIGTTSLFNVILPDVGEYADPKAEDIDSTIFAYVEDFEINLPKKKFKEAVFNACQLNETDI